MWIIKIVEHKERKKRIIRYGTFEYATWTNAREITLNNDISYFRLKSSLCFNHDGKITLKQIKEAEEEEEEKKQRWMKKFSFWFYFYFAFKLAIHWQRANRKMA